MFDFPNQTYTSELQGKKWRTNIERIKNAALFLVTQKRGADMYCIGSTKGVCQFPRFEYKENKYDCLPRPYDSSKPGNPMWQIMQEPWFMSISSMVHNLTYEYLQKYSKFDTTTMKVLETFERSLKILPQSIKVCDTAFSHINMTVVPDGESMNIHVDEDDIFTAVLHIGNVVEGGETNFYDGLSADNPGNIVHKEAFAHGKVQIGYFDKVYHGVSKYKGERYGLNFIMKKSVFEHFDKYGTMFYSKLVDRSYNTNGLICSLPTKLKIRKY